MGRDYTTTDENARRRKIRALNDAFRRSLTGGTVLMTAGVVALGPVAQQAILSAVRGFDDFSEDNDPWQEHDFGALDVAGSRLFFKIDYYDLTRAAHSPCPEDAAQTERVMTIMLAEDY